MKGMLDFLERAGLVKKDAPAEDAVPAPESADIGHASPAVAMLPDIVQQASTQTVDSSAPLNLDQIYAHGGVAPSLYPAERLLRLLDGLSAMDEATRLMAIKAMDSADESWTLEDPLTDAAAKAQALAAHAQQLQANLRALQSQTQTRLDTIAARQEQVVGDIRKQINELEALVARELSRAAADTATQQADLKAGQDQTARELGEIAQVSQRLQSLSSQFGGSTTPSKE
jgi:hypothetical protein